MKYVARAGSWTARLRKHRHRIVVFPSPHTERRLLHPCLALRVPHHHHHHHHRNGVVGYVMLGWKQLRWTPIYDNTTGLGPSALSNRYHGLAFSSAGGGSRGDGGGGTGNEQVSPEAYGCALVADVPPTSGEAEPSQKGSGAFFLRVLPHLELHFR